MLLDTDVLIDLAREVPAALEWLNALPVLPDVSGIAALELLYGCQTAAELRACQTLLAPFRILWPDASADLPGKKEATEAAKRIE